MRAAALVRADMAAVGTALDRRHVASLLRICARAGEWQAAVELWAASRETCLQAATTVLEALVQLGDRDQALGLLRRLEQTHPAPRTPATAALLIGLFARLGDAAGVEAAFRAAPSDAQTFEALIRAHALMLKPSEAVAAFRRMQEAGISPTVGAWDALLQAYESCNDVARALKVWEHMQAHPVPTPGPLVALAKTPKLISGRTVFDEFPHIESYNRMINIYFRNNMVIPAMDLFHRLLAAHPLRSSSCSSSAPPLTPSALPPPTQHTFELVISGLLDTAHNSEAMDVWDTCLKRGYIPNPKLCERVQRAKSVLELQSLVKSGRGGAV
jgi:pentatricopeptide repeat protein